VRPPRITRNRKNVRFISRNGARRAEVFGFDRSISTRQRGQLQSIAGA
jgi:hypothetical protein